MQKSKLLLVTEKLRQSKQVKRNPSRDLVIQAAGVKANTEWLKGIVDLDERGWIQTNEYCKRIFQMYAVGDATLAYSIPARKMPIALKRLLHVEKHVM